MSNLPPAPRLTDEQVARVVNTMVGTTMALGAALVICGHYVESLRSTDIARCRDAVKICPVCRQWAAAGTVIDNRCRACWDEITEEPVR